MSRHRYALTLQVLEVPIRHPKNREDLETNKKLVTLELPPGASPILGRNIDDCRAKARKIAEDSLGRIIRGMSINPDPRDVKKPGGITVVVYKAEERKGTKSMKESRRRY